MSIKGEMILSKWKRKKFYTNFEAEIENIWTVEGHLAIVIVDVVLVL